MTTEYEPEYSDRDVPENVTDGEPKYMIPLEGDE